MGPVILDPKVQCAFKTCDCRTETRKPIPPPAAAALDDIMEHLERCLLKHSMGENAVYWEKNNLGCTHLAEHLPCLLASLKCVFLAEKCTWSLCHSLILYVSVSLSHTHIKCNIYIQNSNTNILYNTTCCDKTPPLVSW